MRRWDAFLLAGILAGCAALPETARIPPVAVPAPVPAVYPRGALNPDVSQDTIHRTICVAGWSASVRPSPTYTNGIKKRLLRQRGLPESAAADYELDHFVPLALGGHPRSLDNLWLQPWDGETGARHKDRLEITLNRLVCRGRLPLRQAQDEIIADWLQAYRRYVPETGVLREWGD